MTNLLSLSDLFFDKSFYAFNRPVFDMSPYHVELYKDKTVIIHNILGINEEDIKIEIKKEGPNHYLYISGETVPEVLSATEAPKSTRNYTIRSKFSIDPSMFSNVTWKAKNGLLYVTLQLKSEEPVKLAITKE